MRFFLSVCLLHLHSCGVYLTNFIFSDFFFKNSLQEDSVPAGVVGRQKNTVMLGLTESTLLPIVPLGGMQAQVKPLTASLFLFSMCSTTRTGTSLAVWQTSAGSRDTPTWSTAPSAMVVPLSFLRALLSILTLVSEVTQGSWDIPQHPEIHSRQGAGSLMPGHE